MTAIPVVAFSYRCDGCGIDFESMGFSIFTDEDSPWFDEEAWEAVGGLHLCSECYTTLEYVCEWLVGDA